MNTITARLSLITSLIFASSAQLIGCESEPPKLSVNINECLSSEPSTREGFKGCQANLSTYTASSPAGCFFVHVEGTYPQTTTVSRDAEGVLRPDSLEMILREGDRFQTHLILFSATPVTITGCEPYITRLQDECRDIGQCLVKLHSTPQSYEGEAVNVSFLSEDRCNSTLGPVLSVLEDVDGVDNDCDGLVDEGGGSTFCEAGLGACNAEGVLELSLTGEEVCSAQPGVSSPETCLDGGDEDCDGRVDEGFEGLGEPCTPEGASSPTGMLSCTGDRTRLRCVPQNQVDDRVCDGIDSDRDGAIDEDFIVRVEECPPGSCAVTGYIRCEEGAEVSTCQSSPSSPMVSEDLCDGVDADCDGRVDEDADNTPLSCGEGVCEQAGRVTCSRTERIEECTPALELRRDELCNELDDDCDGEIDEGVVNACGSCGVAPAELCDGEDNDCDGRVDEDFPQLDQPCTEGPDACAVRGVYQCDADPTLPPICVTSEDPPVSAELCDGLDNDCDGDVDEDVEGVGEDCSVGVGACQSQGELVCRPDRGEGLVCDAVEDEPQLEELFGLDGVDNDCDGIVDESAEICDALDNDGDGEVDEGLSECPNQLRSLFQVSISRLNMGANSPLITLDTSYKLLSGPNTHPTPQAGEQLALSMSLNATPATPTGWRDWVISHQCAVSLSWAVSGNQYRDVNPLNCRLPNNTLFSSCVTASPATNSLTGRVSVNPTPKEYAFGFACVIDPSNDLEVTQYEYLRDHVSFKLARSTGGDSMTDPPTASSCGLSASISSACDATNNLECLSSPPPVDIDITDNGRVLNARGELFYVRNMDESCAALYFSIGER